MRKTILAFMVAVLTVTSVACASEEPSGDGGSQTSGNAAQDTAATTTVAEVKTREIIFDFSYHSEEEHLRHEDETYPYETTDEELLKKMSEISGWDFNATITEEGGRKIVDFAEDSSLVKGYDLRDTEGDFNFGVFDDNSIRWFILDSVWRTLGEKEIYYTMEGGQELREDLFYPAFSLPADQPYKGSINYELRTEPKIPEIRELPSDITLELFPENAYTEDEGDLYIAEEATPPCLTSWTTEELVWEDVEIEVSGLYLIGVYYSRAYTEEVISGILNISSESESESIDFTIDPTSEDPDDWSVYGYSTLVQRPLSAGTYTISLSSSNLPDGEYFMDLAKMVFVNTAEHYDYDDSGDYTQLTEDEWAEVLRFTSFDFGNPWAKFSRTMVCDFLSNYINDQYGLDINGDDLYNAMLETVGEGTSEIAVIYRALVFYELYPPQELRDSGLIHMMNKPFEFGKEPQRAKDDADEIPDSYYEE